MDRGLRNRVHVRTPRFNQQIAEGLVRSHASGVERYVDEVFRCSAEAYPPGVQYLWSARCTPQEEYNYLTAKRLSAQCYEHSKSTIYLMKYKFSVNGVELPDRYLFLPHVGEAGMVWISGSAFAIAPVLVDNSISVGHDSIFAQVNRGKFTFRRFSYSTYVDGVMTQAYVVYGSLHNAQPKKPGVNLQKRKMKVHTVSMHYLLCKYGMRAAFKRYAAAEIEIGHKEITTETHPPSQWVLCRSTQRRPRGANVREYRATDITVAIRKSDYTLTTSSMLAAFFYLADHYPDRVVVEEVDNISLWRILLGHITFLSNGSEGKLLNGINAHMESIDEYVDGMAKEQFAADKLYINDIYDLLMYVIEHFSFLVATSADNVASMYGKRLTVMRYLLSDIIPAIFKIHFDLKKVAKKAGDAPIAPKDVENVLHRRLKPHLIAHINSKHAEVSSVSNPSPCYVFKVTSNIIPQSRATSPSGGKSRATQFDASKVLHASIAEVGSYNHQPKGEPTGRTRINPFVKLSPDGSIQQDPRKIALLTHVQHEIGR